jgi:hypothetical protein
MDRRKFIVNSGRYLLLTSLAAVGGISIFKRKDANAEECRFDNFCKTCKEVKSCSLPQALEYKKR